MINLILESYCYLIKYLIFSNLIINKFFKLINIL